MGSCKVKLALSALEGAPRLRLLAGQETATDGMVDSDEPPPPGDVLDPPHPNVIIVKMMVQTNMSIRN